MAQHNKQHKGFFETFSEMETFCQGFSPDPSPGETAQSKFFFLETRVNLCQEFF